MLAAVPSVPGSAVLSVGILWGPTPRTRMRGGAEAVTTVSPLRVHGGRGRANPAMPPPPCAASCRLVRGYSVGANAATPDLWGFCGARQPAPPRLTSHPACPGDGGKANPCRSLLVTQLVPGSPSAPRSTIPACSLELTQYPGPWHRQNALGSRVERAWVSVDSQWGAAVGTGVERKQRILVEGALWARSPARRVPPRRRAGRRLGHLLKRGGLGLAGCRRVVVWRGAHSVTIARRMLSLTARLAGRMAVMTPPMVARMTTATRVR